MLNIVDKVFGILFPVMLLQHAGTGKKQNAGPIPTHRQSHRTKNVIWFHGFPGWPKLPLVQRLRASPSDLNPVVSAQPEEKAEEDQEPL